VNAATWLRYVLTKCTVIEREIFSGGGGLEAIPKDMGTAGKGGRERRKSAFLCYASAVMNILLVEDSDEVSCITVEYLHELGHEVVAVPEAEKAILQLKDGRFDAVMTDIRLPGMSGIELARALIKDYPSLPVVIASGYGAINVEFLLGGKMRTVLMLPKPYDLPALERTLAEAAALGNGV
jgi:CheY-like chemotaxis protein